MQIFHLETLIGTKRFVRVKGIIKGEFTGKVIGTFEFPRAWVDYMRDEFICVHNCNGFTTIRWELITDIELL